VLLVGATSIIVVSAEGGRISDAGRAIGATNVNSIAAIPVLWQFTCKPHYLTNVAY